MLLYNSSDSRRLYKVNTYKKNSSIFFKYWPLVLRPNVQISLNLMVVYYIEHRYQTKHCFMRFGRRTPFRKVNLKEEFVF